MSVHPSSPKFKNLFVFLKSKNTILKIITDPFLLSFVLAIIVIFFLPDIFQKYKAEITSKDYVSKDRTIYYADFNNDGNDEKIEFRQVDKNIFSLTVFENEKVVEQWNFEGTFLITSNVVVSNVKYDDQKSIFFFYFKNNKCFMSCLTPFKNEFITKDKFVIDFHPLLQELDCYFYLRAFLDTNHDGIKEFYFCCNAGYSKIPRRLFKYDPESDSIYVSISSTASIQEPVVIDTLENDIQIIVASCAVGNNSINDPFSDMFAWLMCYDKNLALKYDPIKIGVYPSWSFLVPITNNHKRFFVCVNNYTGTKSIPSTLRIFNSKLELKEEKEFFYSEEWREVTIYSCKSQPDYFYIIKNTGVVEKLDSDLNVKEIFDMPPLQAGWYYKEDIDGDNQDELILMGKDLQSLIIARSDFSNFTIVDWAGLGEISYCTRRISNNKQPELKLFLDQAEVTILYKQNILFYLKYPIYFSIFVVFTLLFFLIQKTQQHRVELKYKTEKQIAELQLKSIKNQLDPHFTLNIINSIGSLFYKNDNEKANYVFGKYSKMLRTTILSSDKILTTLAEEIDYVRTYLELEQFRYDNKFVWDIKIDENVDKQLSIPKMIIHTFVENAVKHGIRHLEINGTILVSIKVINKDHVIFISDNGIGRKSAEKLSALSTGKGLQILDQILELYSSLMKIRITYEFRDIYTDDDMPSGTEVIIKIPGKT